MAAIDHDAYQARLTRLLQAWKDNDAGLWNDVHALMVPTGKRDMEVLQYLKSKAFHDWLFGVEVADVVIGLTHTEMRILTSEGKKAEVLRSLVEPTKAAGVTLEIIAHPKGQPGTDEAKKLLDFLAAAGGSVAGLPKVKQSGPLHDVFAKELAASSLTVVDGAAPLAPLLAIHDDAVALTTAKKAGMLSGMIMNAFLKSLEVYVDKRRPVKHAALSDAIHDMVAAPVKHGIKLKADQCDVAYIPVVQSGGHFELRIGAAVDDAKLHHGTVLVHFGCKYGSRIANICRTYFFAATPTLEKVYNAVLAAQKAAIAALVPGALLSAAHAAAAGVLAESGLSDKLGKNVGFAMHLELRESKLQLAANSEATAAEGMVFNVSVGVADLTNEDAKTPRDRKYAVQVADTVLVTAAGKDPEWLTRFCEKEWGDVSYDLQEEDEEVEDEEAAASGSDASDDGGTNGRRKENLAPDNENLGRGRRNANKASDTAERAADLAELKKKQDALSAKKNQETYARLTAKKSDNEGGDSQVRPTTAVQCYDSVAKVPPQRNLLLQVDSAHEALLLPLLGVYTPFHINTVKAIHYSQDGEAQDKVAALVRIQFNTLPSYDARAANPRAIFIKELSFRCGKPEQAQKFVQEAQALRRQVQVKDKEVAERATLVKQEKLQRFANRSPIRLNDMWIVPSLVNRKKLTGTLEAHANGFRYTMASGGEHADIIFSNIRHAIFQPAEKETICLLHLHLRHPIMVGKKKVKDVQFYTEVMSDAQATADARRGGYDPDELEEEARDREKMKRINLEVKRFTQRVQDAWDADCPRLKLEWDKPVRQLAFPGNTGKSTVTLMPTMHALVQLVEAPYTCVSLADVEIVSLERVGFNTSTFDLVVVFQDFSREVETIGSIPSKQLDDIRKWLTDIKFFESKIPLQWKPILKEIMAHPDKFLEDGGWAGFLDVEGGSEGEDGDSQESEGFQPSDEDSDGGGGGRGGGGGGAASGSGNDDGSSEDESLIDEDDEDDDDSDASLGSEEEEGMDWDELEAEARRSDKMKDEAEGGDGGDDKGASKKRKGGDGGRDRGRGPPVKKRR